jgi:hypothetical protein
MDILNPDTPIYNSIVFYIITIILIIIYKPDYIYNNESNERKEFGLKENQTLFPFSFSIIFFAIFYSLIFNYISSVHKELIE